MLVCILNLTLFLSIKANPIWLAYSITSGSIFFKKREVLIPKAATLMSDKDLINGINLNTGKEDLYLIDLDNLSMIKYNEELFNVTNVKSTNTLYLSLIIGFIIIIVIQFIMLLKKDKKPLRFKK